MSSILDNAVSGLNNAISRIANAASNIVNASSTTSVSTGGLGNPQDVVSISDAAGGAPNVDLNADLIASKEAQVVYGANADVIKVDEKMQKSLLNALS